MWRMVNRELRTSLSQYANWRGLIILFFVIVYPALLDESVLFNFFILIAGVSIIALTEMESRDSVYISILSTPCKRSDYVFGKFIANFIWLCIMGFIGIVLNGIFNFIAPTTFEMVKLVNVKIILSYILISTSIYHLVYFSLGIKWAKIAYFLVFFALMMGVMGIGVYITPSNTPQVISMMIKFIENNSVINNLIFVIIMGSIMSLFSYISFIFYDKKDF